jgi:hypothetical protein
MLRIDGACMHVLDFVEKFHLLVSEVASELGKCVLVGVHGRRFLCKIASGVVDCCLCGERRSDRACDTREGAL